MATMNNEEKLALINEFIEAFENFLEARGIEVPNDEKNQSPDASTIYGSDYGELQDNIEAILNDYDISSSLNSELNKCTSDKHVSNHNRQLDIKDTANRSEY